MGCAQSEISPQNEPAPRKGCTDVLWLIIYILFWILMVSQQTKFKYIFFQLYVYLQSDTGLFIFITNIFR